MSVDDEMSEAIRFGSGNEPGIRRRGSVRFTYTDEVTGRRPASAHLERIAALAIPPAWTDVWIARDPRSHLQATGRDARGRKQYRYHPSFVESRSEHKFSELAGFGAALGSLRRRVDRDLRRPTDERDQVVATIVRLLDRTSLRIGNDEYARTNRSFGLTTLRNRHVVVRGTSIHLGFRGKSAHDFDLTVDDARLARIVGRCQHLPGQRLFEYRAVDDSIRQVGSDDVNRYLAEHGRAGATAKTFRTWNASVLAAEGFAASAADPPTAQAVNRVIDVVAVTLGNTRAVCRTSYVHPAIVRCFLDGTIRPTWDRPVSTRPSGLSIVERRTLRLLRAASRS